MIPFSHYLILNLCDNLKVLNFAGIKFHEIKYPQN